MSARDVAAKAFMADWNWGQERAHIVSEHLLEALTAAGYRILAPGDLDAATIEACVKEVQKAGNTWSGSRDLDVALQEAAVDEKCEEIATALRNMRGTNG